MASLQSGQTPMVLPGSKSPAKVQWGFPRNLGDPVVSVELLLRHGLADLEQSGPVGRAFTTGGSEAANASTAPPSEGNEVRRDERQEVAVP